MKAYTRERLTHLERLQFDAVQEDLIRTLYITPFMEACGFMAKKIDPGVRARFALDALSTFRQRARVYIEAEKALDGVETRHGTHVRHMKLRHGMRDDHECESRRDWFVVDVEPHWLTDTREAFVEAGFDDKWTNSGVTYLQDVMDEAIANKVAKVYGVQPYPHSCLADYSPTGQWFSTVYTRQVGRRLLVQWTHQQDV